MPIPPPEAGLVISYSCLWHFEHEAGREQGRKDRPSVIVLSVQRADDTTVVTVLPITHTEPQAGSGVEIPAVIKHHLRMDHQKLWIVVSEGNGFDWPGYDLGKVPGSDRYDYGFLPPRSWHGTNKKRIASRD